MGTDELSIMQTIDSAFASLEDDETRARVLQWAWSKYGMNSITNNQPIETVITGNKPNLQTTTSTHDEIPGIAKLTESGEMVLTIRDVKAKNKTDAVIRLSHIAIHAYQILTNTDNVSSKGIITPILKSWRVYDGNARGAISRHKGIIRNGDNLTLDVHSKQEAEEYIADVMDESIDGKWSPTNTNKKKARR